MSRKIYLSPSILAADFSRLGEEIQKALEAGADMIHFDVMDGVFVPNISFGIPVIESLRKSISAVFDVHLMISEPEKYIKDFAKAGGDILTFHIEATSHAHRVISMIKDEGKKVGVAVNPATPILMIKDILDQIDVLLVMSVNPGFSGQRFIPSVLKKIKEAHLLKVEGGHNFLIEVDGGLNLENSSEVITAGADILVLGAYTFTGNITENIKKIKKTIEKTIGK